MGRFYQKCQNSQFSKIAFFRIGLNTVPTVLTVLTVHPALLQITYKLTVLLQRTSFGSFLGHRTPQEIPYTSMETLFKHFWATVHLNKYRTPQWKCFLTNSGPPYTSIDTVHLNKYRTLQWKSFLTNSGPPYTSIDTVHLPGNFFVSFMDHRTPQEIPYTSLETSLLAFWTTVHLKRYRTPQWKLLC